MKNKMAKPLSISLLCVIFLTVSSCQPKQEKTAISAFPAPYLEEITITQLQEGYHSGKFTKIQVVKDYLDRIEAIDNNVPKLNSIIMVSRSSSKIILTLMTRCPIQPEPRSFTIVSLRLIPGLQRNSGRQERS
jgi:amidase